MKLFDCFMYFDEDLVLDLRLNILNEQVDTFVIAEATKDHTGKEKKLNFNIDNFTKFKDKIIYIIVEDLPLNIKSYKKNWPVHHLRDQHQRNALKKAVKAGVKVVIASDSTPIGEIGILEIEQFVLSGVSEMDALIAATRNPAEMCGVLDKLGTVEENKLADLVVLTDNPLENISNIRNIEMVFKDGVSVDLTHPQGTATYWEYYGKKNLKKGYLGDSENQAGFRRGLADPDNN